MGVLHLEEHLGAAGGGWPGRSRSADRTAPGPSRTRPTCRGIAGRRRASWRPRPPRRAGAGRRGSPPRRRRRRAARPCAAGTRLEARRWPSACPGPWPARVTRRGPSAPLSTRNSESPAGPRAGTSRRSATWAHGTHCFTPVSRTPRRERARLVSAVASGPPVELGVEERDGGPRVAPRRWPAASAPAAPACRPPGYPGPPRRSRGTAPGRRRGRAPRGRRRSRPSRGRSRRAPPGGARPSQPSRAELLPEIVALARAGRPTARGRRPASRARRGTRGPSRAGAAGPALRREVHDRAPRSATRSARASLGSPRTRSPMMFFWISEEPA